MSLNVVRRAVFLSFTPHFLPLSDVRFFWHFRNPGAPLVAQLVKNPPAMWVTWAWSLGWEDPLEKGKAAHSSILAGEFHGLYSPRGCEESDMTEWLSLRSPDWGKEVTDKELQEAAPLHPLPLAQVTALSSNGELVTDLPFYSFQEAWGLHGFESLSCKA